MSTFLILVGFFGFIIALVILLIKTFKKKPKKNTGIAMGILFLIFVVGVLYPIDDDPNKEIANEESNEEATDEEKEDSNEVEDEEETETSKDIDNTEEDSDKDDEQKEDSQEKQNGKAAQAYSEKVRPWFDGINDKYDKAWQDLWQSTWQGVTDGSVDEATLENNLNELRDEELYEVKKTIENFKIPEEFNEKQKKAIEEYQEKMLLAVDTRINAITESLVALDGITELDPDMIKETIERGDSYMLEGIASLITLESELGLIEEQ